MPDHHAVVLDAAEELAAQGVRVRVGVRVSPGVRAGVGAGDDTPVWAGGPLGGDVGAGTGLIGLAVCRARRRPGHREVAGFSFDGRLAGSDVTFVDPAAGAIDLGGPVGTQQVSAEPLRVPLLVNQFLTGETAREAIPPGQQRVLELRCHWDLVLGTSPVRALRGAAEAIVLTLRVPVRRDDRALTAEIRRQVAALLGADREDEDALAALAALRHPDSAGLVQSAGGDPARVAWLLGAL